MNLQEKLAELIIVVSYGEEFRDTNNIFSFIDKVCKDDILSTLKFEEHKEMLKQGIVRIFNSISRQIIQELKEDKYNISSKSEFINGEWIETYFDRKKNKIVSYRIDTYPTDDILLYHNKILQETVDFVGKKEVLDTFYKAYLKALSHEANLECTYRRDINALLDLFNDPRYREVREGSIFQALSDKSAEQLSLDELKFKSIEEAEKAYENDGSIETLAQLKKLHMIKAIEDTENCDDYEKLGNMLNEASLDCVRKIIIRRLAYLDANNS